MINAVLTHANGLNDVAWHAAQDLVQIKRSAGDSNRLEHQNRTPLCSCIKRWLLSPA